MAKGYSYSRTTNPTVAVLEAKVAELEGAAGSCCFATGMAATATAGAREPRAAAPSSARRRGGARAARPGPRGRAAAEQRVRGEPSGAPDPPVDVRAGDRHVGVPLAGRPLRAHGLLLRRHEPRGARALRQVRRRVQLRRLPRRRRGGGGVPPQHQARLQRDAGEPDADADRPGGGLRGRQGPRRAALLRRDVRDAAHAPAARARLRPQPALHDQVLRRAQHDGRRRRLREDRGAGRAAPLLAQRARQHHGAAHRLPHAPVVEDDGRPLPRAGRERAQGRDLPRDAPQGRARRLPGPRVVPAGRAGRAAARRGLPRRHALVRGQGRQRRRPPAHGHLPATLVALREPGRGGIDHHVPLCDDAREHAPRRQAQGRHHRRLHPAVVRRRGRRGPRPRPQDRARRALSSPSPRRRAPV